ncbi:replication endonuclease [Vibrio sp. ZSDZ65]|uniref:Replication endonuclease n=1 Tax=Vibrio qingdaonensis TaxID=2829491 RepID=A0A9X3CM72_9VIBR|nr:replication endonuclease [Vibrio qingdaonensis]MCW8345973.1 replication endonuclease [Vibrio qingdaonensis]
MRKTVHDLATGETYSREFLPTSQPTRLWSTDCYDDQFDVDKLPSLQTSDRRDELDKAISLLELPRHAQYKVRLTNWRKPVFDAIKRHGDFAPSMLRAFTNVLERKDYFTALSMIQSADARLRDNGNRYTRNDEEIVELAKAKSRAFSKQLLKIESITERFEKSQVLLAQLGLGFRDQLIKQKEEANELDSLCQRAMCDKWLRRQLRRAYFTEVEATARDLMLVHKSQDAYCSKHSVNVMRERLSDTEQALINTVCYIEDDEDTWFTLKELSAKSTSNPVIRRAEMFVRLKGLESIAQESDHVAMFYTVTTPSRFHVYKGDQINPAWEKANKPSATDGHQHLLNVMTAFRKELNKQDIKIYGLRIVEPHHDGTPHLHCLFFMKREDQQTVTQQLKHFSLVDSPKEKGAQKYRFKAESIDWKRGSAVGYVAKYLSKNIDGANIETDKDTNKDGKQTAESVVSFNRIQGIRQFQFYGGPSVTVWREMRRFREEFKEDDAVILGNELSKDEHFVLETIRKAADEGDFKRFVVAMGGVFVKRKDQTVKAMYAKKVNIDGLFKNTRYGDEMSAAIKGIECFGKSIPTRFSEWKFANKKQFIRGMRSVMTGTTQIFDSLEDEHEYYAMKQEEYERMCDEALLYMDCPAMEPTYLYNEELYGHPPPEWFSSRACPDEPPRAALDLCH